jgi:hypothetical protein
MKGECTDLSPLLVAHSACNVRFEESSEFDFVGRQLSSPVADRMKTSIPSEFGNLRSAARDGGLILGKPDYFTSSVAGERLRLLREEISNVEFDHFRHDVVLEFMNVSSRRRLI